MVSKNSLLAKVKNELNSVVIEEIWLKNSFNRKRSRKKPTAASVISDIISFDNDKQRKLEYIKEKNSLLLGPILMKEKVILS